MRTAVAQGSASASVIGQNNPNSQNELAQDDSHGGSAQIRAAWAAFNWSAQDLADKAGADQQLNGSARVGLPWVSLLVFLRLVTNPRVFERPEPMADAWKQVCAWLACEPVWIPQPTEGHAELLEELIAQPGVHATLVPDTHLAALALEHGFTLCSADGDFARFPALRWLNPLAP